MTRLLDSILDAGEASVIQLARESQAELVVIDERKARRVARSRRKRQSCFEAKAGLA